MDESSFEAGMSRLKKRFVQTHFTRHDRLEYLIATLQQADPPAEAAAEAEGILHKIAGTAGTVGFTELGEAALQVEVFIRDRSKSTRASDRDAIIQVLDAFLDVSLGFCDPLEQLTPQKAPDNFANMTGTTH